MKTCLIVVVVVIVIVGVFACTVDTPITLKTFASGELSTLWGTLLGMLFFVSLLIERSLEIFLTILRSESSGKISDEITRLKNAAEKAQDEESKKTLTDQVKQLEKELAKHRSNTLRYSMLAGLVIGILISISGIRVLANFVVIEQGQKGLQLCIFKTLDIVLTGALLAGGSDGIHKFAETIRVFLDYTTNASKSKKDELGG